MSFTCNAYMDSWNVLYNNIYVNHNIHTKVK